MADSGLFSDIAGNPADSAHDFAGKVFGTAEPGQMGGGRRLHIQRYPVGEFHGFFRFRLAGAGQDLQMDIAAEFIAKA